MSISEQMDEVSKQKEKVATQKKLDRIERMLKWLIVRNQLDVHAYDLHNNDYKEEFRKEILDKMFQLGELLPDISDILNSTDEHPPSVDTQED